MRRLDLAGKQYGRLTLVRVVGVNKAKQRMWECACECGKTHTAAQPHITRGTTISCGCFRKEKATTHGMSRTPEWFAFQHAKARCKPDHPDHEHYFDRGITFGFASFDEFFAEIGIRPSKRHSVDRIDNDKGYEPNNVRWATKTQQERNRRCDNCCELKRKIAELEKRILELTK